MKFDMVRVIGSDLSLKVCVYPEVCGEQGLEAHESATYGLGASDGKVPTAAERQELIRKGVEEFTNVLKAKYGAPPTPQILASEGSTANLPQLPDPSPPAFAVRPVKGKLVLQQRKREDGEVEEVAVQTFSLLRKGVPVGDVIVLGATAQEFAADKTTKIDALKTLVLGDEAKAAKAKAITGE